MLRELSRYTLIYKELHRIRAEDGGQMSSLSAKEA